MGMITTMMMIAHVFSTRATAASVRFWRSYFGLPKWNHNAPVGSRLSAATSTNLSTTIGQPVPTLLGSYILVPAPKVSPPTVMSDMTRANSLSFDMSTRSSKDFPPHWPPTESFFSSQVSKNFPTQMPPNTFWMALTSSGARCMVLRTQKPWNCALIALHADFLLKTMNALPLPRNLPLRYNSSNSFWSSNSLNTSSRAKLAG
mmetsp:Transcript_22657/g.68106  ORF Transcript_22657/g.68106 Transcript_22657/m.68106 type:complete len:203 (-) Transcript_22657:1188-1796(-)